jgi:ribosomal protein S21
MKKILITCVGLLAITCSFAQSNKGSIKTGLLALYGDIPHPSAVPRRSEVFDPIIDAYIAKVERAEKDLAATFLKYNDTYQTYLQHGEEGLKKKAAKQADQNEILAEMGGTEAVSKMSEKEAVAAAKAAYQKKLNTPAASSGSMVNSNMNGLMQDMLNDPKLRARFEKMSEKEKQAFLEAYIAKEIPRNDTQYEKTMAQKNKLSHSMTTTQALAAIQQELLDISGYYSQQADDFLQTYQRKRDSLKKWYDEKYAAIPMIAEGEGLWKDSKQTVPLNEKYQQELEKLEKNKTAFYVAGWQEQYVKTKAVLARFEDQYISNHVLGIHHDIDEYIASVTGNFTGIMKGLANAASSITPRVQE